jgi:hypothetical protein
MREYSKVSPNVWPSERFNSLPSDDGRYLYLYLLTCSHQNSAGAYRLPDGYACVDLRWKPERYHRARAELVAADLIAFDQQASVVMIRRWFRHNPPMSEKHLIGIERMLERLPSETIAQDALEAAQEAWEAIQNERAAKKPQPPAASSYGAGRLSPELMRTPLMNRSR